jgi:hypothetical protein
VARVDASRMGERSAASISCWSAAEIQLELRRAEVACRGPWHRCPAGNLEEGKG